MRSAVEATAQETELPPLWFRLMVMALAVCLGLGGAEWMVRLANDGALPKLSCWAQEGEIIGLRAHVDDRIVTPGGGTWRLITDGAGLRVAQVGQEAEASGAWWVLGDSQVLGQGVAGEETMSAQLSALGVRAINMGIPSYGVEDSMALAERRMATAAPAGLVVTINQINDWEEAGRPVDARFVVMGGWLVGMEDAAGLRGTFLASPISRSHLGFTLGYLALRDPEPAEAPVPTWEARPEGEAMNTARMMRAVHAFSARHPDLPILLAYLPVDRAVRGKGTVRIDRTLRDQVVAAAGAIPVVDLHGALDGHPNAFLAEDHHLSVEGHGRVATALAAALPAAPPTP